jgi:molybdopterin-synthase adenylyltransferase
VVGSFVADELARAGISKFLLVDPDIVEWRNLTRTVYGYAAVGMPKVDALKIHLMTIFPDISALTLCIELRELRPQLRDLLASVDLVVSALDDPEATGIVDRYCYALSKPALFVGIYRGASGGEVIAVDPAHTPCFGCATGGMRESLKDVLNTDTVHRERDYGTNKLVSQVALGSDIHFVCNSAVKIALSMLSFDDANATIKCFMGEKLKDGVHYLMLAMEPNYYISRRPVHKPGRAHCPLRPCAP